MRSTPLIVATLSIVVSLTRLSALAQSTNALVSVSSSGAQGNDGSVGSSISGNGRYVTFFSRATNLVAGDTNGKGDVFLRDIQLAATTRVSVHSSGAQGNGDSGMPRISMDGRYVAFNSTSTNLVSGDTNNASDIFVHDRQVQTTTRISLGANGVQGNNSSPAYGMSADFRYVAFQSFASNLVLQDFNGAPDVFWRDLQTGATVRVSVDSGGAEGDDWSGLSGATVSGDGRFVAFSSQATNLVIADGNGTRDAFVHDIQTGTTTRVSVASSGVEGNGLSCTLPPVISFDGNVIAFDSLASNLVLGDTNAAADIFVHDRVTGATTRVSVNSAGSQSDGYSLAPGLSIDGRYVVFHSFASNLVPGDTNNHFDVFLNDRVLGTTMRLSMGPGGIEGNGDSVSCAISTSPSKYVFGSESSNLDILDTNGLPDIFLGTSALPPTSYCTSGTSSVGCVPSILASRNPSVSMAQTCVIMASNLEGQRAGLLFYGIDNGSFTPLRWAIGSSSYLCVKPPTQRSPNQNSGGASGVCNGTLMLDWNVFQSNSLLLLGAPWSEGDKLYIQAWYRDPLAAKTTNLSNAVELTYVP